VGAVRVKKTRQTRKHLEHGKCDAETYDQHRGAERHYGKSPFRTLFDIRVHVYLRRKARFVPKAARTQTPSDTGLILGYFSLAWRVSACPQRRHSKVCWAAGFVVAIMYIPHFGHGGRRRLFWHARGITAADGLRYP
jgi:hypothetical protein